MIYLVQFIVDIENNENSGDGFSSDTDDALLEELKKPNVD